MMKAIIEIKEPYVKELKKWLRSLPKQAVELTLIKNDLDHEIQKRVDEIKQQHVGVSPLEALSSLRKKYVRD